MIYFCKKCGEQCDVISVSDGFISDDARGLKAAIETFVNGSDCCHADFVEADEFSIEVYDGMTLDEYNEALIDPTIDGLCKTMKAVEEREKALKILSRK